MKYIGITGKRGSGRETFAWLLGKTLQIRDKVSFEQYQVMFQQWTNEVKKSKTCIGSSNFYILESFGGTIIDNLKLTIPSLCDLDLKQESPDLDKPFNINTLSVGTGDITVGDFIILYADKVIKSNFGQNFWVNIAEQWAQLRENDEYATEQYIIYWDVKTDAEAEYIKRHNGNIIRITCPERLRGGGYNTIKNTEPDYKIRLHKDFVDDCEQIWNISQSL